MSQGAAGRRSASAGRVRVLLAGAVPGGPAEEAWALARALRDAGMEVVPTGLEATPERLVATAVQEDVDAVGIWLVADGDVPGAGRVAELVRDRAEDVLLFVGGVPLPDPAGLLRRGVARAFAPGTDPEDVVAWVAANAG